MIVTITCNPAIDKTIYEDKTIYNIGGKGINVSKVLKQLDCDTLCLGFMGKDNSDLFLNELDKLNIKHDFVLIDGSIRTNTKRIIDNELYEDNEIGPEVNDIDKNKLFNKLEELNNDIAVISGSAPINVEDDFYEKLHELNVESKKEQADVGKWIKELVPTYHYIAGNNYIPGEHNE